MWIEIVGFLLGVSIVVISRLEIRGLRDGVVFFTSQLTKAKLDILGLEDRILILEEAARRKDKK